MLNTELENKDFIKNFKLGSQVWNYLLLCYITIQIRVKQFLEYIINSKYFLVILLS